MEKILYSKFENAGDILEEVKKNLKPRKQSKVSTLFLVWREIVGNKLAEMSRPVGLSRDKVLFVTCKNSLITQELYLNKVRILKSVQYYADSLNLKVEDICFSHKKWEQYNSGDSD